MNRIIFILLLITLMISGCDASYTEDAYRQRVDTWKNGNINTLLSSWGPPSNEYITPDGSTLYTWLWIGGSVVTTNYTYLLGRINSNANVYWCKTTFTVVGNTIVQVSFDGNRCVSEEE